MPWSDRPDFEEERRAERLGLYYNRFEQPRSTRVPSGKRFLRISGGRTVGTVKADIVDEDTLTRFLRKTWRAGHEAAEKSHVAFRQELWTNAMSTTRTHRGWISRNSHGGEFQTCILCQVKY